VYTVDASVWVNAFDQAEPGYATSRQLLEILDSRQIPVVVPTFLLAELAGAISRTRQDPAQAMAFAEEVFQLPHVTLAPLDLPLIRQAAALAAQHRLRGGDATYAAVALNSGFTLVTLDNEHLTRLAGVVTVQTPEAALSDLSSPEPNDRVDPSPADDVEGSGEP
jgi:predicted nucleic acid-binding protein